MNLVFNIGRAHDNDLVIADPHVSNHHARITKTLDGLLLEDLNSSNGTFVGKERIRKRQIRIGDPVRISPTLELDWSNDSLLNWANEPVGSTIPEDVSHMSGNWSGTTGTWTCLLKEADKTKLTIGRSPDNDFVISHPRVSRHHAQLTREDGKVWLLEDLESSNGTFVDGERITRRIIDEDDIPAC